MITVKNLKKSYGPIEALKGISFTAEKGEILGLLGLNGAGKTTTIRILSGYLKPTSGFIAVGGHDLTEDPLRAKEQMGYLPESNPLYDDMLSREYLMYVAQLKGFHKRKADYEVKKVLERCAIESVSKRMIKGLSKGYRQRLAIAQALIGSPPVLLLDEPTMGLDPIQVTQFRKLILELKGECTVLISSHILPEIEQTADRVVIIESGRLVKDGKIDYLGSVRNLEKDMVSVLHESTGKGISSYSEDGFQPEITDKHENIDEEFSEEDSTVEDEEKTEDEVAENIFEEKEQKEQPDKEKVEKIIEYQEEEAKSNDKDLLLSASGDEDVIKIIVGAVSGVLQVEKKASKEGVTEFLVTTNGDRDFKASISRAVTNAGLALRDIRYANRDSLEGIFMETVVKK